MTIDIEIEHKDYYHLTKVLPGLRGEVTLTTIETEQKKAIIKLFVGKEREKSFLKDYTLTFPTHSSHPRIINAVGVIDKSFLILDITTEKGTSIHDRISLKKYIKKSGRTKLLLSTAFLLLTFFGFMGYKIIIAPETYPKKDIHTAPSPVAPKKDIHTAPSPVAQDAPSPAAPVKDAPSPVVLNEVIYFYPNSIKVKESETRKLEHLLDILSSHPELKVTIAGHCALFGTKKGREELSRKRAEQIASYLSHKGWKPKTPPVIVWYGAEKIISKNPEKNYLNRRVVVTTE